LKIIVRHNPQEQKRKTKYKSCVARRLRSRDRTACRADYRLGTLKKKRDVARGESGGKGERGNYPRSCKTFRRPKQASSRSQKKDSEKETVYCCSGHISKTPARKGKKRRRSEPQKNKLTVGATDHSREKSRNHEKKNHRRAGS